MKQGSNNARLAAMEVGDYHYVETSPDKLGHTMRTINTPKTRRPKELEGREFSCEAFTAVGTVVGSTKVLVRIERTS